MIAVVPTIAGLPDALAAEGRTNEQEVAAEVSLINDAVLEPIIHCTNAIRVDEMNWHSRQNLDLAPYLEAQPHSRPNVSGHLSDLYRENRLVNATSTRIMIALTPLTARDILSSIPRSILLPRSKEVHMIADILTGRHRIPNRNVEREEVHRNGLNEQAISHNDPEIRNSLEVRGESAFFQAADSSHNADQQKDRVSAMHGSQFVTIIQGMGGLGKSTITAIVVSKEDIRSHFADGIAWIKLDQQIQNASMDCSFEYSSYLEKLIKICRYFY